MFLENARDYLLNKLLFPNIISIDSPGFIISKTHNIITGISNLKRFVYSFEDLFVALQNDTVDAIGLKLTRKLFFDLGKEMGYRIALIHKIEDRNIPIFLIINILERMLSIFSAIGANEKISIVRKNNKLIIHGTNTIISRKTGIYDLYTGIIEGTCSLIYRNHVTARVTGDSDKEKCEITVVFSNRPGKKVHRKKYQISDQYERINSPKASKLMDKRYSLNELIRFRRIIFENTESGKLSLDDNTLIPFEIGLYEMFYLHYKKNNLEDLFVESMKKATCKISSSLFRKTKEDKKTFAEKLLTVLGFGFVYINREGNKVKVIISQYPYSRFGPGTGIVFITGFLEALYEKKIMLKSTDRTPEEELWTFISS